MHNAHCIQNKLFDINSEASTIKKNESYFTDCQYLTDPGRKWLLLQPVLAALVNNKWSSFFANYTIKPFTIVLKQLCTCEHQ